MTLEPGYLSNPNGVELIPGTTSALSDLRKAGFALVTVTNQSGIACGLYTEEDYHAVAARFVQILAQAGTPMDATEYCPHHPDFTGDCTCRKPGKGMYQRASAALRLNLKGSYYIGDKVTDVAPAIELGGQGVLVRTGYGSEHEGSIPDGTWVTDDFRAAADLILKQTAR